MGSIYRSAALAVPAEVAGDFLERFAYADVRVFSMSTAVRLEGIDRIVTLADGTELAERNVTVDAGRRRVVYTVPALAGVEHHQAELRVVCDAHGTATLHWTVDILPDAAADGRERLYDDLFAELVAAANAHTVLVS